MSGIFYAAGPSESASQDTAYEVSVSDASDTSNTPLNNIFSATIGSDSNNNANATVTTDKNVIIGVAVFWAVLAIVTLILGIYAYKHIKRRRIADEERRQRELREARAREAYIPPLKPGPLPIVVVLPNDEVAFGWKIEHTSTDDDSIKDDDDSIKDSRCSSFNEYDEKYGSSSNLDRMV